MTSPERDGDGEEPEAPAEPAAEKKARKAKRASRAAASDDAPAADDAADAPAGEAEAAPKATDGAKAAAAPWTPAGALRGPLAYGLATLTGVLYFLAFPGIDLWPLSFVALVPLIIALRRQPTRRAAGLGWMAGFTMTMTGFYWLLEMLKVFSGFPLPLCFLFMCLLCGYQGGRIALCGWLYGRAESRGWPAPVVFLLAFATSELLFPLLFPWYYGATVHNAPVLMQVADIGGPILVGVMLAAGNLAVAEIVLARLERRGIDRRLVAIGAAAPAIGAIYGAVRMRQVDAAMSSAPAVQVGIVQGNLPLFDRKRSIAIHTRLTAELKNRGAELVVWSEAAVSRNFGEANYEEEVRQVLTKGLGVPTIVGTVLRRPGDKAAGTRSQFFNTALLAGDEGKILGRYDKQFLLAFGEYLPFGDTFPILYKWSPNSGRFTAGTSIEPLRWGDHRISALICYEDIIPAFVNDAVRHADPDLIVNLTNDAWFGDSTEPWIHMALSKMRAIEHRRFLVRATNSGVSVIVDANGRVVTRGGTFQQEVIVGQARFMRAKTPFEVIGDGPWWLGALAIGAMSLISRPKKRV